MNYVERLALEIESRKTQLRTLRAKNATFACSEVEREIEMLKSELKRYREYETHKTHHIYAKNEN
ncbi:hypothetical protein QE109_10465 [Fusibacter bizertensis]|jgi:hypothetical protein|uniref:Uncharacterized protein n=1 Tax=Fusibacter bizertensis TaxID=1488331 RepID=A0ABT6NDU4_9FIRM|nr:hypothetical protein [Fusibacter bizertensis]MDH8678572.1 hypothetical protein [Fusibacter bizertensis]